MVAVAGAIAWCGVEGWRFAAAQERSNTELVRATHIAESVRAFERLRARPALISDRPTPSERLLGMVTEAASQASMGPGAIKSVESEQEAGSSAAGMRRQSVRVALEGITLLEFGGFLDKWRGLQPSWIPIRIDMTPAGLASRERAEGPVRWNVRIAFCNVYLAEGS